MSKRPQPNVLTYNFDGRTARSTVKRHYLVWRSQRGVPERCDMPECPLDTDKPMWNAVPINLILDHVDGNAKNNHPENLRLVCPNCGAQLDTHGGANAGRIQNAKPDGYAIAHRDGRRDATVFLGSVQADGAVGSLGVEQQPSTASDDALEEKE